MDDTEVTVTSIEADADPDSGRRVTITASVAFAGAVGQVRAEFKIDTNVPAALTDVNEIREAALRKTAAACEALSAALARYN
jgi:hypothetical protein